MNKQESTKKTPIIIISMYRMNGGVVVVCNHKGSCIIIIQNYLNTLQDNKLRLGQIFEIEPAVGQCMAIARRHASLSFLDIDVLPLYMYIKGQ